MRVAIVGYGIEGESSYRYWRDAGHDVIIVDERDSIDSLPGGVPTVLGKDAFMRIPQVDLIVRSPGVNPQKIVTDAKIWSATNEFFEKCPAQIIGVTGTKGKGTTCSLITSILRSAGKKVHLVGNIGAPALDILATINKQDIVVFELSSFQAWDLERSPHVAVILMLETDHLDVHADMSEYLQAKANITTHQSSNDILIHHPDNIYVQQIVHATDALCLPYGLKINAHVEDGWFWYGEEKLCSVKELKLPGAHNVDNACAAISAARYFVTEDFASAVRQGLNQFTGLPHRLKFVRDSKGVSYYDDSIATTPGSAIAALGAFDRRVVLILGGSDKGADYGVIIDACKRYDVRIVLAIGTMGKTIEMLCNERGVPVRYIDGLMDMVVAAAIEEAKEGDVVILSPASASFDQYNNYAHRGDMFVAAVERLAL